MEPIASWSAHRVAEWLQGEEHNFLLSLPSPLLSLSARGFIPSGLTLGWIRNRIKLANPIGSERWRWNEEVEKTFKRSSDQQVQAESLALC